MAIWFRPQPEKKERIKKRVLAIAKREKEEDSQGRRRSKGLREENQEKEVFLKPREDNGLVFSWQLEVSRVLPSSTRNYHINRICPETSTIH